MNRLSTAISLSVSVFALGLASLVWYQSEIGGPAPLSDGEDIARVRETIESLAKRIEDLETGARLPPRKARSHKVAGEGDAVTNAEDGEPLDLDEQMVALTQRLAVLEDAEKIAELAKSGNERMREKWARSALAKAVAEDATPEERLASYRALKWAFKSHGKEIKKAMDEGELNEGDIVMPILGVARDGTLGEEFRAKALAEISYTKIEEIRQPLMDIFFNGDSVMLRQQSLRNLMSHTGNVDVQNAIMDAARNDPNEEVRATAQRRLGELVKIARHFTPDSPVGQMTNAEVRAVTAQGAGAPRKVRSGGK